MKTLLTCLGALLVLAVAGNRVRAQHYHPGPYPSPAGMCFHCGPAGGNAWGTPPGCTIPAFPIPPFAPNMTGCMQKQVMFPTHPFARSPRDFFMMD